nr:MAG TPA: YvrJ protein family protein [Caudoviricetes sp.]
MTVADITQLIGSLGFPIVACCALFWDRVTNTRQQNENMATLTEAINNNTMVVNKLLEKLEGDT